MYANFTAQEGTGTGDTIELSDAIVDRILFSKSFADGDLVAYVLEDSGGVIKVAGVGTYVSATDDITRNDTWNWNGTVIDDNPSTNITLSGGTHTVRCDVIGDNFYKCYENELFNGTVLVASGDEIIYQNALGFTNFDCKTPLQLNSVFGLASVSKTFTSVAIMMLIEEGNLRYEDKLSKYFPDFPNGFVRPQPNLHALDRLAPKYFAPTRLCRLHHLVADLDAFRIVREADDLQNAHAAFASFEQISGGQLAFATHNCRCSGFAE